MTKEEQATLDGLDDKLDRLIDLMSSFVSNQMAGAGPAAAGRTSETVLEEGQRLSLLEELQIDQIVNLRVQNILGRGIPVGQVEQLLATERRRYLQELSERGGVVIIRG